jgi:hypothetical protein
MLTQVAIDSWGIVPSGNTYISNYRASSSKNWITTSGTDCVSRGVSKENSKTCILSETGDTYIGMCFRDYGNDYTSINRTTIVALNTINDRRKFLQTMTHEVGHSLGLEHSKNKNDIMYPIINNRIAPSTKELEAVYNVYVKGLNSNKFFKGRLGRSLKQRGVPKYYIDIDL